MRRLLACIIVLVSSLAVAPLSGCVVDELPANGLETGKPLSPVSKDGTTEQFFTIDFAEGRLRVIGQVTVRYPAGDDPNTALVTYELTDPERMITGYAVTIVADLSEFPRNPAGCPRVGKIRPLGDRILVRRIEVEVDVSDLLGAPTWLLTAHARVASPEGDESAWAAGDESLPFPGCPSPARYVPLNLEPTPGIAPEPGEQ